MRTVWSIIYGVVIVVSFGCTKDHTARNCSGDCLQGTVSYENDIKPLIIQSCATNQGPGTGCHDAWIFEYENILRQVRTGNFKRVVVSEISMPPIPNNFNILPLTPEERKIFECWICDGAPNN